MKINKFTNAILKKKLEEVNTNIIGILVNETNNTHEYVVKHKNEQGILFTTIHSFEKIQNIESLVKYINNKLENHLEHCHVRDLSWGFLKHELTTQYYYNTKQNLSPTHNVQIKKISIKINLIQKNTLSKFILQIQKDLYKNGLFISDWDNGETLINNYVENIPNLNYFSKN